MNRIAKRSLALLLATGLGSLASCSDDQSSVSNGDAKIEMTPLAMSEWDGRLADYPPQIVVVDYWATWCTPCIERFPHMVEMAEKYGDQGVSFVAFNLDDPSDTQAVAQANDFLNEVGAGGMDNLTIETSMFDAMEHLDLISIPAVSIYDRSGEEVVKLTGDDPNNQFDEEDVEQAIQETLNNAESI